MVSGDLNYLINISISWTRLSSLTHFTPDLPLKTIQLTYIANQITGFFMKCKTGLNWVKTTFENPNLQNLATQKNKALTIGIQRAFLHNGAKTV